MIKRHLEQYLLHYFNNSYDRGLILAGIVGSGKTTLIKHCLSLLKKNYEIFEMSGDDANLRFAVQQNSKYLHELIRGTTSGRVLIFIDEVQKSEFLFDALKFAFDKGNFSFIISGSNPAYLNSIARKRLQRRSDFKTLSPLSLPEILVAEFPKSNIQWDHYLKILDQVFTDGILPKDIPPLVIPPAIKSTIKKYLNLGGLPLAYLQKTTTESLLEVQKCFERGFEPIRSDNENITDAVAIELGHLHSKEFTYQNIMNKTRTRSRDLINQVLSSLLDHGYTGLVTPYIFDNTKKTYLKKYYYIDPGLASYLVGIPNTTDLGYRVEGLVYSRLKDRLQFYPLKDQGVYFYKSYQTQSNGQLRFTKGEVDCILKIGTQIIPIEIKSSDQWSDIDTEPMRELMLLHSLKIGLILYAGPPRIAKNILFWPYWLL
jgi:predicted AAA+ superfamily ATPase